MEKGILILILIVFIVSIITEIVLRVINHEYSWGLKEKGVGYKLIYLTGLIIGILFAIYFFTLNPKEDGSYSIWYINGLVTRVNNKELMMMYGIFLAVMLGLFAGVFIWLISTIPFRIVNSMSAPYQKDNKGRRTGAITIICIIGFMFSLTYLSRSGSLTTLEPGSVSEPKHFSEQLQYWNILNGIIGIVCMVGLWNMKKWAVFTYSGFIGLSLTFFFTMGMMKEAFGLFIIPIIIAGISLAYIKQMN